MKGMPIYNPTLAVEAVGFREHEGRQVGVMVTPWFMNLTVLPSETDQSVWVEGETLRLDASLGLVRLHGQRPAGFRPGRHAARCSRR